ncbi:MAG: trypsin-like peptidase domain-containing protein [Caldilineaceae bacterium]|nr:trypsin-like peptidase domain-containing protein [Caldilineaceae bacterium]
MSTDTQYELIPPDGPRRSSNRAVRIVSGTLIALALIVAVIVGPMAWSHATGTTPATPALQAAQLTPSSLLDDQEALANLYDQVLPSVVNIQVRARANSASTITPFGLPNSETPDVFGQGSGFIYDNDGHIVTNNHVVDNAVEVTVVFSNGFWADADVVATDPQADLAVLKVTPPEGMEWRPLTLAAPDSLRVGHLVIAIGNPFGLEGTMTRGIVSAIGRGMPVGDLGPTTYTLPEIIQTDAAINPGNSGGPLLDLQGNVVGVNFAIESPVRSNSGVGFTIPVSIVRRVVPELIKDGKYEYAYLGLSGASISPQLAKQLDLPNNQTGVYVSTVIDGGPSAGAGLQGATRTIQTDTGEAGIGGDIITAIDGVPVRRFEDLVGYLVTDAAPGQEVTLTIRRDGKSMDVPVTLGERPGQAGPVLTTEAKGAVNAREAIAIATDLAEKDNLLQSSIAQKLATPGELDGQETWNVELTDEDGNVATIIVAKDSGEVLQFEVK